MKRIILLYLMLSNFALGGEVIKLVGGQTMPPLMWDDNGIAKGIAFEVGKAILKEAGYDVVTETCPWSRCQYIAEHEGAFIIAFSQNEERLQKFTYTDVNYFDEIVFVTKVGREFPFEKDEDIKGKVVGVSASASFGPRYEKLKKLFVVEDDNDDTSRMKKLMAGRIDAAVIASGAAGVKYVSKLAGLDITKFTILPNSIDKDPNFMATGKKTKDVELKIKKINDAIKRLSANGTLEKLLKAQY